MDNSGTHAHRNGRDQSSKQAKSMIEDAVDSAVEKGQELSERASRAAGALGESAKSVVNRIEDKTDGFVAQVGAKLSSFAESVRDGAPKITPIKVAASTVANGLQSSGDYLSEKGATGMVDDVVRSIRSHPVRSVWLGLGAGLLIGSIFRRR